MDPTSFAASVLALLTAAGASCEFLYNFILDISEAPEEIHVQAIKLQCLHQSISSLIELYEGEDALPELHLDGLLKDHIYKFLDYTHTIKRRVSESSIQLGKGRVHQLRERLSWLLSDRRMRKFYNSLDDWLRIFSTAVQRTQLELLISIYRKPQATPPVVYHEYRKILDYADSVESETCKGSTALSLYRYGDIPRYMQNECALTVGESRSNTGLDNLYQNKVDVYLARQSEPVGLRAWHWSIIDLGECSADLKLGPTIIRTWSKQGGLVYKTVEWNRGMSLASTLRLHRIVRRRIRLLLSTTLKAYSFSFTYNITMNGLLDTRGPAYAACRNGDWELLRSLIQRKKLGMMDTTAFGSTLLHIAAQHNHADMVMGLIQEGATVDAENDFGETPLQVAIMNECSYAVLSHLLRSGADLNHQDSTSRTPLHVCFNSASRAVIEYHYSEIDSTSQDASGMTVTQYVAWTKRSTYLDLVRCCKDDMSCLDIVNEEGKTAFHLACQRGNVDLVRHLCRQEAVDVSRRDNYGRSALYYATESSMSAQTIEILVEKGLDIHAKDCYNRTVLHHAASRGHIGAVETLSKYGAASDLDVLDDRSRTPMEVAAMKGHEKVVEILRTRSRGSSIPCSITQLQPELEHTKNRKKPWRKAASSFLFYCSMVSLAITAYLWHFT